MQKNVLRFMVTAHADREPVIDYLLARPIDRGYLIEVTPKGARRSGEQNARLWAVYRRIIPQLGVAGVEPEDLHEAMCQLFIEPEVIEIAGLTIERRHTSGMTAEAFSAFMDKVCAWAAEQGAIT